MSNLHSFVATFKQRVLRKIGKAREQQLAVGPPAARLPDADDGAAEIMAQISGATMTTLEAQLSLINAVRYTVKFGLPGAFVECGVWRGGSSMAIALTLLQEGVTDRDIYLYDTFQGMTQPSSVDRTGDGVSAATHLEQDSLKTGVWCLSSYEEVRRNLLSTGYPSERLHFIQGAVEETIPECAPFSEIALLRLDTDWYESTKHELEHLYPRLVPHGIVVIDDYGYWEGARKAVDEFFGAKNQPFFLHRIDRSARSMVKPVR
jgi:O-methyltransferase